ncbi:zinc-ribbon domain-containing protein [Neobacillus sedimentimangrovi]|uniref:Zinc-ribbon domain-containing protein n=1 Tax=Neobacillus sedimentimangrovi TaxID=2699460 RepID=A0ABS8QGD6_9BACI|nr:zinc-ribbon domain-containing protein [Neobacillus sedimentimangrovi]MCD4838328.1 zinc-ribbon domain-containing protein [Neobacillus sedimentimangrovi]
MKYCKECGSQLSETASFCNECGTSVNGTKNNQAAIETQPSIPRQPMSKRSKVLLISGIAALLLLFGVHKIIETFMSKERLIEKFETALLEKDAKELAKLLTSNDKKLEITEKSVKGFIKYLEKNPEKEREIIETLEIQAESNDQKKKEDSDFLEEWMNEWNPSYSPVSLEQKGKFLFYDKYQITINAVYLTVETNYKDTVLYIDGKKIATANEPDFEGTFGPFLPGIHTLKGTLKTDFIDLKDEKEFVIDGNDNKESVDLYFDAEEVTVELPHSEYLSGSAKLYINGKDVGVNVLENHTFGPVLTNGSMKVQVEVDLPWGTVKTEEAAIEGNYIELDYKIDDDVKTTAMNTVHTYLDEYIQAYTSVDTSKLTTVTDKYKEEILSEATTAKENEEILKAQYLGTDFDLDSFNLDYNDGWNLVLTAQSKLKGVSYYANQEAPEMEETSWDQIYYLTYDTKEKKWLINSREDNWSSFNTENIHSLKSESPKLYTSVYADN